MITYSSNKFKSINQKKYDSFIEELPIHRLNCSCGKSGYLTKHAYYKRNVKMPTGIIKLKILRLYCYSCGKTHAVFPICIVPYSQILFSDHVNIIKAYTNGTTFNSIMFENEYIDESNIRYIIKQYLRHWKELLIAFKISVNLTAAFKCLKAFKQQFMQIKSIQNIVFT